MHYLQFFNGAPIYGVPGRFSYQHILLLLISVGYIFLLSRLFKNKSFKTQRIVLAVIMGISLLLFVGRMFFGWENARIYNQGSKTTLLPLELCNLNLIITFIAILINKKTLNNYLYYVSILGALVSLFVFPDIHMWPDRTIFHYMFFDYYISHTNLVAIPIVMIAYGWYKPELKKVPLMLLITFIVYTFVFGASAILRNFNSFATANYMYTFNDANLPILKDLYNIIPYPYIYALPLIILIGVVFTLMGLPFAILKRKEGINE